MSPDVMGDGPGTGTGLAPLEWHSHHLVPQFPHMWQGAGAKPQLCQECELVRTLPVCQISFKREKLFGDGEKNKVLLQVQCRVFCWVDSSAACVF